MYFNYIKKCNMILLDGRENMIIGICGKSGSDKKALARILMLLKKRHTPRYR